MSDRTESSKPHYEPKNNPIRSASGITAVIEILGFNEMVIKGDIDKLQVFYERIAQEIYIARKKNYSWGFRVIEPEFRNFSDRIILSSPLFKEEELPELSSIIFKLFAEFCNMILSVALQMQIPIRGIACIDKAYRGSVKSKKPQLVSGDEPLLLADLLKVFSFNDIFPDGLYEGLVPAVDMPFYFGKALSRSLISLSTIPAVGIFMPYRVVNEKATEVAVFSNILKETDLVGETYFACNWKAWLEQQNKNPVIEEILEKARDLTADKSKSYTDYWEGFIRYSESL